MSDVWRQIMLQQGRQENETEGGRYVQNQRVLHNDVLRTIDENHLRPYGAEAVWEDLLLQGEQIMKRNEEQNRLEGKEGHQQQHLVVVEVGAQNENQSLCYIIYSP